MGLVGSKQAARRAGNEGRSSPNPPDQPSPKMVTLLPRPGRQLEHVWESRVLLCTTLTGPMGGFGPRVLHTLLY